MGLNRGEWYRNGATLDMDFYNNRYMVSLTTPVTYTSLTQFISAVSGTFTRSGESTTAATEPFYLGSNQNFVSRAGSTTQITAAGDPFYMDASQAFVSRASSLAQISVYGNPFYLDGTQTFYYRAGVTTQLTATGSPFYLDASQAFVSRAASTTQLTATGSPCESRSIDDPAYGDRKPLLSGCIASIL